MAMRRFLRDANAFPRECQIARMLEHGRSFRSETLTSMDFRGGLLRFRQMDLQDAVFVFRRNFAPVGILRQREAAQKSCRMHALHPVIFLFFSSFSYRRSPEMARTLS